MKRHISDKKVNHSLCNVLFPYKNQNRTLGKQTQIIPTEKLKWKAKYWKDLEVGEIIFLQENDQIPADIVVLSTSESDGLCFLETKNLDGETNLKIKRAVDETCILMEVSQLKTFSAVLTCEPPHSRLESFSGLIKGTYSQVTEAGVSDMEFESALGIDNILLRGCLLRNTEWVVGLVTYTGNDSKIRLNVGETRMKRSSLEKQTNYFV